MNQAIAGHSTEFKRVWYETLSTLGYRKEEIVRLEGVEVFLRNTFLITPSALDSLVTFMNFSISTVVENSQLRSLLSSDAHYREAKKDVAKRIFRAEVYYWFPFVFERLPVFFAYHSNMSVFHSLEENVKFSNEQVDTLFVGI